MILFYFYKGLFRLATNNDEKYLKLLDSGVNCSIIKRVSLIDNDFYKVTELLTKMGIENVLFDKNEAIESIKDSVNSFILLMEII
jgi:hypothetical protein